MLPNHAQLVRVPGFHHYASFTARGYTSVGRCVLFAVLAIYLKRLPRADATASARSRWLLKAYLGFAVVATLLVLLFTVG